jgi:hypothetical protein
LQEAGRARAQVEGSEACRTTTVLGRAGYWEKGEDSSNSCRTRAFGTWIGASCTGGRVLGRRASKGFQVVVEAVLTDENKGRVEL